MILSPYREKNHDIVTMMKYGKRGDSMLVICWFVAYNLLKGNGCRAGSSAWNRLLGDCIMAPMAKRGSARYKREIPKS